IAFRAVGATHCFRKRAHNRSKPGYGSRQWSGIALAAEFSTRPPAPGGLVCCRSARACAPLIHFGGRPCATRSKWYRRASSVSPCNEKMLSTRGGLYSCQCEPCTFAITLSLFQVSTSQKQSG